MSSEPTSPAAGFETAPVPPSPTYSTEGVEYKPGTDTFTHWSNLFNILTGRMSQAGIYEFKRDRDIRNEVADCKRCEERRDYLLKYSTFVFL